MREGQKQRKQLDSVGRVQKVCARGLGEGRRNETGGDAVRC